jgi:MtN3 and saliva related transmembrane protein
MNEVLVEVMGAVAGVLGMVGFVPQVAQTIRRKTAGDLNLHMLLIFVANTTLWMTYGVLKHAWALAGSDAVVLVLLVTLLAYKTRDLWRADGASGRSGG